MIKLNCKDKDLSSPARVDLSCSLMLLTNEPAQAKTTVKGSLANPLYKQLAKTTGEQPDWNFHKYLINRNGQVVGALKSMVSPNGPEISQTIRRALDAHPITEQ